MSHAFGTLRTNMYQSDLVQRKKNVLYCCPRNNDKPCNTSRRGYRYRCNPESVLAANRINLVFGQYSKVDLERVCTVSAGAPPTTYCSATAPCDPCQNSDAVIVNPAMATQPFRFSYTIDPLGELFGKTQCGELNYTEYMVANC